MQHFFFDDKNYLEIKGNTIGTNTAQLIMGYLGGKQLYCILPNIFDADFTGKGT